MSQQDLTDFQIDHLGTLIKYNGRATEVIIPDNVLNIALGAFEDNLFIRSVVIPDTVLKIETEDNPSNQITFLWM